jgi:hypothetical protein
MKTHNCNFAGSIGLRDEYLVVNKAVVVTLNVCPEQMKEFRCD